MAQSDEDFIKELEQRYNVSSKARESDIAQLGGKNEEDREGFKQALQVQYEQRGSSNGRGSSEPSRSWNESEVQYPDWYQGLMQQELAQRQAAQAEAKQRQDALYGQLTQRASQGLNVNADDPSIRGQVDAYRAEGTRAQRDYLSDVAEAAGPYANLRGEQRMSAERLGQGVSGFQAELIARERERIANEVSQALAMQGSLLTGDQNRALSQQLGQMQQALSEAGLGLQSRDLDLRRDLGFAGLDLQRRGQDLSMDQFLRELALREYDVTNRWDYNWLNG